MAAGTCGTMQDNVIHIHCEIPFDTQKIAGLFCFLKAQEINLRRIELLETFHEPIGYRLHLDIVPPLSLAMETDQETLQQQIHFLLHTSS